MANTDRLPRNHCSHNKDLYLMDNIFGLVVSTEILSNQISIIVSTRRRLRPEVSFARERGDTIDVPASTSMISPLVSSIMRPWRRRYAVTIKDVSPPSMDEIWPAHVRFHLANFRTILLANFDIALIWSHCEHCTQAHSYMYASLCNSIVSASQSAYTKARLSPPCWPAAEAERTRLSQAHRKKAQNILI